MLKNYIPSKRRIVTHYEVVFDDGCCNGFSFSCDANGNLSKDVSATAIKNYHSCLWHPEKFTRYNKVIKHENTVFDAAHGTCTCGNEVYLLDGYLGACKCDKCGKWYNLFGQELNSLCDWDN